MSEKKSLLLEIGVEEIPASYLKPAAAALLDLLKKALITQGIGFKTPGKFYYTPRRLSLIIDDLVSVSEEKVEEKQGPPAKIAKDADGNWSIPAKKFAQSHGLSEDELFIKETDKGSYITLKVRTGGEQTSKVLIELLPDLLTKIGFPKSMRWPQSESSTFARPVRWLCCLFGNELIEFRFAGLKSSNCTYGHRFAHPEAITIRNSHEYLQKLNDAFVIVNPEERRRQILEELSNAAEKLDASLVADDELIDEVVNLVEYPKVLTCNLGGFMELPREVLQTALAKHQRAFVVEKNAKLLPYFLIVTNAPKLEPELAKLWFERMAISRLEDADFFIKEDLSKGLEALVEEEARVEWIKGIGSLADKTRWLIALGLYIGQGIKNFNAELYKRAAYLAKADLLTNLVREKEFTSLQGVAGAIYAEALGEFFEVCLPIREQYTDTPSSLESAILGIADRILNICATFAIGKLPKGSRDPFALRRQSTALIKIAIDNSLYLDVPKIISKVFALFSKQEDKVEQITAFMQDRLQLYAKDKGFPYDWVNAVITVAGANPYDAYLRLDAFRELNKGEEFKLLAVGQKRVANITKEVFNVPLTDARLFKQEEEKALWEKLNYIKPELKSSLKSRNYKKALELLLAMRPVIDNFFNEVFVMVDDNNLRENRLHLLNAVKMEFLKVADFSQIVAE